ncbi:MAG: hypothetical protein ACNI3A_05985 [Desulfovibrio sp.]|uniref:hypothetical protein n=1 Tax=Desulfovibrio sp. 7SRBS1 TaxID=3378064 RepID=UPI003B404E52
MSKKLSNPFSTGGGGAHFEANIQASFATLMLTGGHAPCLPCWPIVEIKLQGKIDGFDTDDLIIVVENHTNKEQRKLLGQIKHSISITKGSVLFGEVMQAAWNDFNNPEVFTKDKDSIALITGPLSATDADNVRWLLNHARHTKDANEFFRHVEQSNFCSSKSREKLNAIQHHLKAANGGNDISDGELYNFLNHFHLLGYDLDNEFGVVLPLLHSHISQFNQQYPHWIWPRVVEFVQKWNQNAGSITPDKIPDDLQGAFKQKTVVVIPEELTTVEEEPKTNWAQRPEAPYLALAVLIGGWEDNSPCDSETIQQLLGISYDEWLNKARIILPCSDSPLSLKNGTWKIINRAELWSQLGSHILDKNLDTFMSLAVSVLKEQDPAFELPAEERYAASIRGKVLKCSHVLREGIAEGLAMLGNQPESCCNCSQEKAETTCALAIQDILSNADWKLWGSLNNLLPALAEAAPENFLDAVEKTMRLIPCPFDELFSQEGKGITGSNYLTGLLWALEGLAWDEQYLVSVCVTLGELASHDPGGQWANRPSNSLATILLPWLPQTLATVEKRKVAVEAILKERPDIAWDLLVQLLPDQMQTSSGTHKPSWRKTIPEDREKGISTKEYWEQVNFYAELAVKAASKETTKLSVLIDLCNKLPKPVLGQLLQTLASQPILGLPEEQRLPLWNHLINLANRHRKFSKAKWSLSEELILRIEHVAEQLAPQTPFYLYQHLFTNHNHELYEENGDWKEQQKKLNTRREKAILEIFQESGTEGVIRFAESVPAPDKAGFALGAVNEDTIENALLPLFLDSTDHKRKAFISSFIRSRCHLKGWEWCDLIDKQNWTHKQIGQFLAYLPFTEEAWKRASDWLRKDEKEFWSRTLAIAYQADENLAFAIAKLIKYGRPNAAINCLARMLHAQLPLDTDLCVKALTAAISSNEPSNATDKYNIIKLIKVLQTESSVNEEDLYKVEWAYVPLLNHDDEAAPQLLETKLANDPKFFCKMIQLIYRSQKKEQPSEAPNEKSKADATNAWRLLNEWRTPPGIQADGTFNGEYFTEWLQRVKDICTESGHLDVALIHVGHILIHTPPDPTGLWIHRTVADALNAREADKMRRGFSTGKYNSRGVYTVDPTGKPERELAEQYLSKAEEIENAGFHRIAVTLRELAKSYNREANAPHFC